MQRAVACGHGMLLELGVTVEEIEQVTLGDVTRHLACVVANGVVPGGSKGVKVDSRPDLVAATDS